MDLRASDADRERAIERLHTAALEGRLTSDELEQRIQAAYDSRWCGELERLVADVTPPAPPAAVAAPAPQFVRRESSTNGFAIASLVCAVAWFMWLGSICAVAFGHVALRQIKQTGQGGRGLAIAGLVLGYGGLALLGLALISALL